MRWFRSIYQRRDQCSNFVECIHPRWRRDTWLRLVNSTFQVPSSKLKTTRLFETVYGIGPELGTWNLKLETINPPRDTPMLRSTFFALLALPALVHAQALPPELDCIPRDALGFVSIRGDLLKNETLKPVRDYIVKHDPTLLKKLETRAGFSLDEIARVTFLFPSVEEPVAPPLIFVTLNKPYDKAKLLTKVKATSHRMWMEMPTPSMSRPSSRIDAPPYRSKTPDFPSTPPAFPKEAPDIKRPFGPTKSPPPKGFAKPSTPEAPPKESDEPVHEIVVDPQDRMFDSYNPGKPDLALPVTTLGQRETCSFASTSARCCSSPMPTGTAVDRC